MINNTRTKEPQYTVQFDVYFREGPVCLGPTTSHLWRSDPRHLSFLLARYKFVAKMLSGKSRVLEVGCGDAFSIDIVLQEVEYVHGVDFDPLFIEDAKRRYALKKDRSFEVLDFTKKSVDRRFDAVYSLDVLEHISGDDEDNFMKNICKALEPHGVCIIGTPSIHGQVWASKWSKAGHINCKDGHRLKEFMGHYFHNVFVFSMNDEVVHTGFYPMAHYLFAIGVEPRI